MQSTWLSRILVAATALVALCTDPPGAAARVETLTPKALYEDGPDGLYLLDGRWLYRADPRDDGLARRFYRRRTTAGWRPVRIPNAFNPRDFSQQSFDGSVGWYRKDFIAPQLNGALRWAFRFESVNYRARVWLSGRPLGSHAGAYLPFELPARAIRRGRVNRLVVRVDSRRRETDVPPRGALGGTGAASCGRST
jgi:beta-glucuronidase